MSGTLGRVYGGDKNLIHIKDGTRNLVAKFLAMTLNSAMRREAVGRGERTNDEAALQKLCPGCYMVVGYDMLVALAKQNNQSLVELGATMSAAFQRLAIDAAAGEEHVEREDIVVILHGDH